MIDVDDAMEGIEAEEPPCFNEIVSRVAKKLELGQDEVKVAVRQTLAIGMSFGYEGGDRYLDNRNMEKMDTGSSTFIHKPMLARNTQIEGQNHELKIPALRMDDYYDSDSAEDAPPRKKVRSAPPSVSRSFDQPELKRSTKSATYRYIRSRKAWDE